MTIFTNFYITITFSYFFLFKKYEAKKPKSSKTLKKRHRLSSRNPRNLLYLTFKYFGIRQSCKLVLFILIRSYDKVAIIVMLIKLNVMFKVRGHP